MKPPALLIAALLAAGCAPTGADVPAPPSHEGSCDAAPVQRLIGQPASPALAADAQRDSGARIVRWLRPGMMVTMEYSADRLNIELDANDRVTALRCG